MVYNFRPLVDFSKRAREVESELADDPRALAIYRRTIDSIDPAAIAAVQHKYADELTDFNASGPFKYADIPHWIGHKARFAARLDFDRRRPSTILDIGTGCAHLLAISNAFGHRSIGIDVEFPFYSDVCEALGIDRRSLPVTARQQLPDFGMRFDIVTAMAIVFNRWKLLENDIYWSNEDWEFFVNDVVENQLKENGLFLLGINGNTPEVNKRFFTKLKQAGAGGEGDIYMLRGPDPAAAANRPAPKLSAAFPPTEASPVLIFDTLRNPIGRLRHPGATVKYMEEARASWSNPIRLRGTFPIPGQQSPADLNSIRFESSAIEFPSAGEYYFYCDLGAFKILVLDDSDAEFERVKKIFSFVAKNIIHSRADVWMCMLEGFSGPFYWPRLQQKFFYSDQPLQLMCGHSTHFLASVLHTLRIQCRIAWIHQESGPGHIVLEAWNAESQQWVMLDPDWGLCVADKAGRLLSAAEIVGCLRSATPVEREATLTVVNTSGKCWNREDFSFPPVFTGHISWSPSRQSTRDPAQPGVYFDVLSGCIGTVRYEAYYFDDDRGTARWQLWPE